MSIDGRSINRSEGGGVGGPQHVPVYLEALQLASLLLTRLPLEDPALHHVLLSTMPANVRPLRPPSESPLVPIRPPSCPP